MDSESKLVSDPESKKEKKLEQNETSLNNFLNKYKGIEYLWKNVEKKKNAAKYELRDAEKDLVEATKELGEVIGNLDENNKKNSYDDIIKKAYNNNLKGAEKFIEKFPNWSIAIGKMFSESPHYQRIAQSAAKGRAYKDITSKSNFELKRTGKGKIQGGGILNKIKSGWKSLKTAFSNYVKPDDIGKASKSSLARRIKKFGEEINRPWRMWWEFAAGEKSKLSKDEAKATFKEKLKKGKAEGIVKFFNYGLGTEKNGHELCIVEDNDGGYTGNKGFMYMNTVIEDLDKNLLKDIQFIFGVNENTVETNIKNSARITASKIFQSEAKNLKPEDYKKFFDILGIKEYYDNKSDNDIIKKVDELLTEIEGEEQAEKLAGDSNENIKKFLQLARANYVIKNNKMDEASEIIENLNEINKIFDIKASEVKDGNLLNENKNELGSNTKDIIDDIEKFDKNIAEKFTDAINNILAPTDKQNDNVKKVKDALDKIKTNVNQCKKLTTEDEVKDAIEAIKTCKDLTDETNTSGCRYNAKDGRKEFLADVAIRLGVRGITDKNVQDYLCISKANPKPPYDSNPGAILVQKLRNLIGYGLGYGTSKTTGFFKKNGANSLPDLGYEDIVDEICEGLGIQKKK